MPAFTSRYRSPDGVTTKRRSPGARLEFESLHAGLKIEASLVEESALRYVELDKVVSVRRHASPRAVESPMEWMGWRVWRRRHWASRILACSWFVADAPQKRNRAAASLRAAALADPANGDDVDNAFDHFELAYALEVPKGRFQTWHQEVRLFAVYDQVCKNFKMNKKSNQSTG